MIGRRGRTRDWLMRRGEPAHDHYWDGDDPHPRLSPPLVVRRHAGLSAADPRVLLGSTRCPTFVQAVSRVLGCRQRWAYPEMPTVGTAPAAEGGGAAGTEFWERPRSPEQGKRNGCPRFGAVYLNHTDQSAQRTGLALDSRHDLCLGSPSVALWGGSTRRCWLETLRHATGAGSSYASATVALSNTRHVMAVTTIATTKPTQ